MSDELTMCRTLHRISDCLCRLILGVAIAMACCHAGAEHATDETTVLPKFLAQPLRNAASCPDPLVIWTERYTSPRVNVAYFLRIDLANPRIEAFVALSEDPDGPQGPAEGVLTLPEELMRKTGALALVNANAFGGIATIKDPLGKSGWYRGRAVDIIGLAVSDYRWRSPDHPRRLAFWLDGKGKPHLGHPSAKDGVRDAIADWSAPLVVNGRNLAGIGAAQQTKTAADKSAHAASPQAEPVHPRSMLGFDESGGWLLLVVVDGRQGRHSMGMTLSEGAGLMLSHGCTQAINLDGGGSSILIARDSAGKPTPINKPSDMTPRPVPIMIGVRQVRPKG